MSIVLNHQVRGSLLQHPQETNIPAKPLFPHLLN